MRELATLTQFSPRVIRYYVQRGVLPSPQFRGTSTRYQRLHLLRALAIRRLHREGSFDVELIRKRVVAMDDAELLLFVCEHGVNDEVAVALELRPGPSDRKNRSEDGNIPAPQKKDSLLPDEANDASGPWLRLRVLPELELRVARAPSAQALRAVEWICRICAEAKMTG